MRIQALWSIRNEDLTADCCIVGSGPAGLTVARELAGSGLDVLLLESGGLEEEATSTSLNETENVGAPREPELEGKRNRILGGTSHTWSGRSVVFDPIDFAPRPWVPHSGWPITRDSLAPYFVRSQEHLGAPVADNDDPGFVRSVTAGTPELDPANLEPYAWALSRDAANPGDSTRFGPRALAEPMPGVRALTDATVVGIELSADRSVVEALRVSTAGGDVRRVEARLFVLAGGAIENARMLLASQVGTGYDQVGRYLMDHLRGPVAVFSPDAHARLQRLFGNRKLPGGGTATPGFALSPAAQEREQLTNCAAWLFPTKAPDDPFTRLAAARRDPASAVKAAVRHAPMLAEGALRIAALHRAPVRSLTALELHTIVEQRPDPESRVRLAERRDALGVPISRIDWHVDEQEMRTVERTRAFVVDALAAAGLPTPRPLPLRREDGSFALPDVAHPMGTTRMSASPEDGVVDVDCAVHGVRNLFIAGSSVFPTGGHANPTQLIVALAVRLADEIRRRLAEDASVVPTRDAAGD
jgi:choline dehydrogenase-like flavoprotein